MKAIVFLNTTTAGPYVVAHEQVSFHIFYTGIFPDGDEGTFNSISYMSQAGVAQQPEAVGPEQNITKDFFGLRFRSVEVSTTGLGSNVQADFVFVLRE